jgi:putative transposase
VLNYTVTSNHIHLLIRDNGGRDVIPKSIHLIAGRTAQEFNQRKNRKGAFWEDRYHATAVETGKHLIQCLVYMDLNIIQAGVVSHPADWPFSGYNEIQAPRTRYGLINYEELRGLLGFQSMHDLAETYRGWIDESVKKTKHFRDGKWTESVAVGSRAFVAETKERLGVRAKGRKLVGASECCELREPPTPYNGILGPENEALRLQNEYYWENSV